MDDNTKLIFGAFGLALLYLAVKLEKERRRLVKLIDIVDNLCSIRDQEFQAEVDERFEEIVDQYYND